MRKILLLLFLAVCVIFSVVASELTHVDLQALSAAATRQKFPDADSVLLHDVENVSYQVDGLAVTTDDFYEKVLSDKGRERLRELRFPFNASYQKLEVNSVEVIPPAGAVRKIDVTANSRVAVDSSSMSANIYDPNQKLMAVNVPDLAVGDVLHVRYTVTDVKVRVPGQWSDIFVLQSDQPILYYRVVVDAPAKLPLRSFAIKDEIKNSIEFGRKDNGERIEYSWTARNVPQVIPEPNMPPLYTAAQRVLVSTSKNWQDFSDWYYKLCLPHLKSTPEIEAMVKELTAKAKTPAEKIMALFQFVSQKIRYMGITAETEAPGLEPHDVALTFNNRYGVCRDKAALLVTMLELAGFKAYPVIFMAGEPKDDEVPNSFFNHAIVAVEESDGQYMLMDPTYETTTELFPSTLSNMSYLVAKPDGEKLLRSAIIPVEKNLLAITTDAAITPDGALSGSVKFHFEGVNDQIYREAFSRWPQEYRKQFFSAMLRRALPGAELEKLTVKPADVRDMKQTLEVEMRFSAREFLPENPSEFLLQTPLFGSGVGAAAFVIDAVGLEKRKYMLRFFSTCGVKEEFRLALPPGCRILSLPKNETVGDAKLLLFKRSFSVKDGVLTGKREFQVGAVEIAPARYIKLKELLRAIDTAEHALPIARLDYSGMALGELAAAFPAADALLLDENEVLTLTGPGSYESVTRTVRRILTYAGVKKYSEVRVDYNPVWENVSITAQVTTAKGEVKKLSEKELNLMDAPWVSSAPRYPAGKILVAALPGVEPGSTVQYTITRSCKERPFFAAIVPFAGELPIFRKSCTLVAPHKQELKYSENLSGVKFSRKEDKSKITYRWEAESVPRLAPEPARAPAWLFAPTVFISDGSYADYGKSLNSALKKGASNRSKAAVLVQELMGKLPANLSGKALHEARVTLLRDYVAKNIRRAGPALNQLPLSALSGADETLASGYGNSADRAILLGAMLESAGVDYRFVAATSIGAAPVTQKLLGRYPENCFNAVLVYLPEGELYLNDADEYAPLGATASADKLGLDLSSGRLITIRPPRRTTDRYSIEYLLKIAPTGDASLEVIRRSFGLFHARDNRFYSETTGEKLRLHFQELAAGYSQSATVTDTPLTDFKNSPGTVKMRFNLPRFAAVSDGYMQFELPGFSELASLVNTASADRKTPYWRGSQTRIELAYKIQLPAGAEVVRDRPERIEIGSYGSASFYEYFEPGRNRLRIDCSLILPVELVDPLDYRKLVRLQRELTELSTRRVILKLPETAKGK